MEVRGGDLCVKVAMPPSRRNALLEGTWDSTALLMANAALVRETASKVGHPDSRSRA